MKLSILEEVNTLTIPLITTSIIIFPVPKAVDRIIPLKLCDLPTDVAKLQSLVDQVYKRRKVNPDLKNLHRD